MNGFIERFNNATNIIALILILIGATVAFKDSTIGSNIITGSFGLLVGKHLSGTDQKGTPSQ